MRRHKIKVSILCKLTSLSLLISFFSCSTKEWETEQLDTNTGWPISISCGPESYVFDYQENIAIHYFDSLNAEKIWFKKLRNHKKDALRKRNIKKEQTYLKNGWLHSDSTFLNKNGWSLCISKGLEKFIFDYNSNTTYHFFDSLNAEKIIFTSIQAPLEDALNKNNAIETSTYMRDGWIQWFHNKNDKNWPSSITKNNSSEQYVFSYTNNTATHYFDDMNAEIIHFSNFNDPQIDALEKKNIIDSKTYIYQGWTFDGSYGKKQWPQSMSNHEKTVIFDYQNKTATLHSATLSGNTEVLKIWFSKFEDPATDFIEQNNVIHIKKPAEMGWTYFGCYGKYEYPTSMSKGNERYDFEYKEQKFMAHHFVNGRRTETLEFTKPPIDPMRCINDRYSARIQIKEYRYNSEGILSSIRYYRRGNYDVYLDIDQTGNIFTSYCDGVYTKGSGFIDDKIADVEHESFLFFESYIVYDIDKSTGTKKQVASFSNKTDLTDYLLTNYLRWEKY